MDKQEAQKRVDQIQAFREELIVLGQEGVVTLPEETRQRLDQYHSQALGKLAARYDVDTTRGEMQLSWGMRIASFLGALALSAAVFFFFFRFWGYLSTTLQVAILVSGPLLGALATELCARREKTLYFTSLLALVTLACFILNLTVLGTIFNINPSQNVFLAWGLLGLIFSYTYRLRLLLVFSLGFFMVFIVATLSSWGGGYWLAFWDRPENLIVAGSVFILISFIPRHHHAFPGIYRVFGLLGVFIAILILSYRGELSYFPLPNYILENLYLVTGLTVTSLAIWIGIRSKWGGVTNLGSTFFVIYLYAKLCDWWWDWMPKYLFFLILGLMAILLLFIFRRIRTEGREVAA